MKRIHAVLVGVAAMVALTASTSATQALSTPSADATTTSAVGSHAPHSDVIDHRGLADIRFGDSRSELAQEHGLTQARSDCSPRLPEHPEVSPVFDDGQLVLLWADPPQQTPEGLGVGADVATVQAIHPGAETLHAPADTFRYDGLLASEGDRAYLFLHDGSQVQKLIVGYAEHVRLLFTEQFGTC